MISFRSSRSARNISRNCGKAIFPPVFARLSLASMVLNLQAARLLHGRACSLNALHKQQARSAVRSHQNPCSLKLPRLLESAPKHTDIVVVLILARGALPPRLSLSSFYIPFSLTLRCHACMSLLICDCRWAVCLFSTVCHEAACSSQGHPRLSTFCKVCTVLQCNVHSAAIEIQLHALRLC